MARFSVIDFETTGVHFGAHDRVVEVGVVQLDEELNQVSLYESVINPKRDPGPQHVHGIQASWLLSSPTFDGVANDLIEMLTGTTVIAHNATFDASFLISELSRIGLKYFDTPSMSYLPAGFRCSKRMAKTVLGTSPQSFEWLCGQLGVLNHAPHTALGDALATAEVVRVLSRMSHSIYTELASSERLHIPKVETSVVAAPAPRSSVASRTSLTARLDMLPPMVASDSHSDYLSVLLAAMADLNIDELELRDLEVAALASGLTSASLRAINRSALASVMNFFLDDGVLSQEESEVLDALASRLGVSAGEIHDEFKSSGELQSFSPHSVLTPPAGAKFVLTGFPESKKREIAFHLQQKGLDVASGVSKKVAGVIALDPDTQSGKAVRARELGIPILGEAILSFIVSSNE
jgi:DNA polymerase-3 subunit epsilon